MIIAIVFVVRLRTSVTQYESESSSTWCSRHRSYILKLHTPFMMLTFSLFFLWGSFFQVYMGWGAQCNNIKAALFRGCLWMHQRSSVWTKSVIKQSIRTILWLSSQPAEHEESRAERQLCSIVRTVRLATSALQLYWWQSIKAQYSADKKLSLIHNLLSQWGKKRNSNVTLCLHVLSYFIRLTDFNHWFESFHLNRYGMTICPILSVNNLLICVSGRKSPTPPHSKLRSKVWTPFESKHVYSHHRRQARASGNYIF